VKKFVFTFITGGVRSGKSSWAERYVLKQRKKGSRFVYIATSQPTDEEMKHRIFLHQKRREQSDVDWLAIEQPTDIGKLSKTLTSNDLVLLDCLTTLLTNELFKKNEDWVEDPLYRRFVFEKIWNELMLFTKCAQFVLVSNEVCWEGALRSKLVYHYIRLLGHLHQRIVERADLAIRMEFGVPIAMKGELE
jgi:adenosylcobinamide kinase / adenosylcobinamide-phosphate guanylyltransferase